MPKQNPIFLQVNFSQKNLAFPSKTLIFLSLNFVIPTKKHHWVYTKNIQKQFKFVWKISNNQLPLHPGQ